MGGAADGFAPPARAMGLGGILDDKKVSNPGHFDDLVDRGVRDEHGSAQAGNDLLRILRVEVVKELLLYAEGPPADAHLGFTVPLDLFDRGRNVVQHVGRIGRSPDRGDGPHPRQRVAQYL